MQVDIRVTIDGTPIPLPPQIAEMVLAVVDHRENIFKMGAGMVLLEYSAHHEILIKLLRLQSKAKARSLAPF